MFSCFGLQTLEIHSKQAKDFNLIKAAYNQGKFDDIYNKFAESLKEQVPHDQFIASMEYLADRTGDLSYSVDYSSGENAYYIIGFFKDLAAGQMNWAYDENDKFITFSLSDGLSPTFFAFISRSNSNVGYTLIADKKVISFQGDTFKPLQSVMKINVAVEFARQVVTKQIDPQQWVKLDDLNLFYLRLFDSGHQSFLDKAAQDGKIVDNSIQLEELAKGMLIYSSNCNTEYLQTLLTQQSINHINSLFKLEQQPSVYLTSSIIPFINHGNLDRELYIERIESLTFEQFFSDHLFVHDELVHQTERAKEWLQNGHKDLLDGEVLSISANFFTQSSSNNYAAYMQKLNEGQVLTKATYDYLYPLLGIVSMSNPIHQKMFSHAGVKGGSSGYPQDPNCQFNFAIFVQRQKNLGYQYQNVSQALFMRDLKYETEYQIVQYQQNFFSALVNGDDNFINEIQTRSKPLS